MDTIGQAPSRPYLSDEDAEKLLRAVRATDLFEMSDAAPHPRWVAPGQHIYDGTRIERINNSAVVRSIYWFDWDGNVSAFHDTGEGLVYDAACDRYSLIGGSRDVVVPAYVAIGSAIQYVVDQHKLIEKTADANYLAGRKAGQKAMQDAIRNLIGAASLVELEEVL